MSSDTPVQTVFQFDAHKSIFCLNYTKYLQHHEYSQTEHMKIVDIEYRDKVEYKHLLLNHYGQIPGVNIHIWYSLLCP